MRVWVICRTQRRQYKIWERMNWRRCGSITKPTKNSMRRADQKRRDIGRNAFTAQGGIIWGNIKGIALNFTGMVNWMVEEERNHIQDRWQGWMRRNKRDPLDEIRTERRRPSLHPWPLEVGSNCAGDVCSLCSEGGVWVGDCCWLMEEGTGLRRMERTSASARTPSTNSAKEILSSPSRSMAAKRRLVRNSGVDSSTGISRAITAGPIIL